MQKAYATTVKNDKIWHRNLEIPIPNTRGSKKAISGSETPTEPILTLKDVVQSYHLRKYGSNAGRWLAEFDIISIKKIRFCFMNF